jgi:hypothetical protein
MTTHMANMLHEGHGDFDALTGWNAGSKVRCFPDTAAFVEVISVSSIAEARMRTMKRTCLNGWGAITRTIWLDTEFTS